MASGTELQFGALLRNYRKDAKLSQTKLAERLHKQGYENYGKSSISKWENGRTKPSSDVVETLEDILVVKPGLLLKVVGYRAEAQVRGEEPVEGEETSESTKAKQEAVKPTAELMEVNHEPSLTTSKEPELNRALTKGQEETATGQRPYEETPHKQKMRELAGKVASQIQLPTEFHSFIYERKPGRWFINDHGFAINISKTGKIETELELEYCSKPYLYKDLLSHLQTGGFADVVTNIDIWKLESGNILGESQELFKNILDDVGEKYGVIFSFDSLEQGGFMPDFFKTIYLGAILAVPPVASLYRLEGRRLNWVVYNIYCASTNIDLEHYRDSHIEFQIKYTETDLAKQIRGQSRTLRKTEENIRNQLEKFSDMERLPGHCELC